MRGGGDPQGRLRPSLNCPARGPALPPQGADRGRGRSEHTAPRSVHTARLPPRPGGRFPLPGAPAHAAVGTGVAARPWLGVWLIPPALASLVIWTHWTLCTALPDMDCGAPKKGVTPRAAAPVRESSRLEKASSEAGGLPRWAVRVNAGERRSGLRNLDATRKRWVGAGPLAQLGGASRKLPGPGKAGAHKVLSNVPQQWGLGSSCAGRFRRAAGPGGGPPVWSGGRAPAWRPSGPCPPPPLGGAHPTPRPVALLLYSFSHLLQRWGGAVLGQGSGLRGSTRETSDSKCPSASDTATASGSERQGDVRLALEGGAAVGETFAAVQVRGDVPDAHGLRAGGG